MTTRLRVLMVIASSERGGAERGLVSLLEGLDRDRFEVRVACHGDGPMLAEYERHAAEVVSLDLAHPWRPGGVRALARLMARTRSQVVHTHLWTADAIGGAAAALSRVPARVATVWGEYFLPVDDRGWRKARKRILAASHRFVYRLFDRVVAISDAVAEGIARRPGLRVGREKITVIRPGIDAPRFALVAASPDQEAFAAAPRSLVVSTVANFFPIKGHRFLVEAMPLVLRDWPQVVFALAGDGPELPRMKERVADLGLEGNVRFLGSRGDVPALLTESDVVVVPSVSEGLGLVVLEALALGRPVVATRVGGIPEIVEDGVSGRLVPPRDPGALARAIVELLSDADVAGGLGAKGRAIVRERFTADTMVRRTEALYLDLGHAKGIL